MIGTPEYMSPEQVMGEDKIDARSDLYSLGVILYQLLTRRLPFEDKSPIELAMMQLEQAPMPPSQLASDVDPRLEAICLKALKKSPADRYATAREMRADLRRHFGGPDSIVRGAANHSPSTRVVPKDGGYVGDEAALSKAATLLAPVPSKKASELAVLTPTTTQASVVTQPSAASARGAKAAASDRARRHRVRGRAPSLPRAIVVVLLGRRVSLASISCVLARVLDDVHARPLSLHAPPRPLTPTALEIPRRAEPATRSTTASGPRACTRRPPTTRSSSR